MVYIWAQARENGVLGLLSYPKLCGLRQVICSQLLSLEALTVLRVGSASMTLEL